MTAARLFDGRSALDRPVLVQPVGAELELREIAGDVIATWPIASLKRCDHDAPGPGAVLGRTGGVERLALEDPELLRRLAEGGARLGRVRRWGATAWLGVGAGLVGSLAVAALMIDRLPALATPFVPQALERSWSASIVTTLEIGAQPCTAAAGRTALGGLIATLANAAHISPVPRFVVLDDDQVNAFTLPDGRLVILHGLIAEADADEVAGVLAHELGHVAHRDPTREVMRGLELDMLARGLGWGGGLGSRMAALSYGRRAEAAADASALVTLRRAGLRADGLGRFFRRMQALEDRGTGLAFLSDHPATAARIAAVQTDATGAAAMTPDAWKAVRAICR